MYIMSQSRPSYFRVDTLSPSAPTWVCVWEKVLDGREGGVGHWFPPSQLFGTRSWMDLAGIKRSQTTTGNERERCQENFLLGLRGVCVGERTRHGEKDLQWIIGKRRETLVCPPWSYYIGLFCLEKKLKIFFSFRQVDFLSLVESRCSFFFFFFFFFGNS